MLLKDKVAIITGGASGLGEASCLLFAKEGAQVVIADMNMDAAEKVKESINTIDPLHPAKVVYMNVADRDSVEVAVKDIITIYGRIDILINNAGITKDSTLAKMTYEQWDKVIDVNLTGVFNCTKAVIPHMIEQKYGRIINTSSVTRWGSFGQSQYSAAKAGLVGLTKTWAKELGRKGITTNAVAPGFILTDMVKAMPEHVLEKMKQQVPLGTLGEPLDIANAYLYLASDGAKYVNGTVLEVDGGIVF